MEVAGMVGVGGAGEGGEEVEVMEERGTVVVAVAAVMEVGGMVEGVEVVIEAEVCLFA